MTSPSKGWILVVDDDLEIRDLLAEHLNRAGYRVSTAENGNDLFRQFDELMDLVILDVMMPGDDGFSVCQKLRQRSNVPVIMLTASSDEADRVIGLELGADDYVAKPFSPRELIARIKALLRRTRDFTPATTEQSRFLRFGDWRLDTLTRQLFDNGGLQIELSGADFNLLMLFLEHPNQVLDRDTISDTTRGRGSSPFDRSIDVQISRLRQRLGDGGKHPSLIKTIRGQGYLLASEVIHEY